MDDGILPALFVFILLFFAAYFAVCETAFAACSRVKLKMALDRGDKRAKKAVYITENFDKAITTILIGTNITHIAATSIVTLLVTRSRGIDAVAVSTVISTIVVFFVGEMLPKSIAKKYPERFSLGTAGTLCFFMLIFTPVSAILTGIGRAASKLTKGDSDVTVTGDELYDIIENMTDEGELEEARGELVSSALSFGDVTVESIITARVDLVSLDIASPLEKIVDAVKTARHSRIPVYEGTIDNIIGILQVRKFVKAYLVSGGETNVRELLDEAFFIHSSAKVDELLPVLSGKKLNLAVVMDNYGGTLGIVTVEDILEVLVGDIWDEEDVVELGCVRNSDGSYTFSADEDIETAFDFMDYKDPSDFDFEHKLLGEWTYEQFDTIPDEGDSFSYNGLSVVVLKMDGHRITKLCIVKPETAEGEEEEA
ncbi:MAG: hemolysin family protein [Oscillospiraceae bacterium]|nr:hemolysin family protein [Oscillospiraceae bacterium]